MRKSSGSYGEKLGYVLNNNKSVKKELQENLKNQPAVTKSQNVYDSVDTTEE